MNTLQKNDSSLTISLACISLVTYHHSMQYRTRTWLYILAMVSVISFLLFFDIGEINSRTINEILNSGHFILFGGTAFFLLWIFCQDKFPAYKASLYVKTGAITISIGILSEFIQLFTPDRDFELRDMVADSLGAMAFLAFAYSLRGDISPGKKRSLRAGSLLATLLMLTPIFPVMIDDRYMQGDFPLLDSFESFLEMSRWKVEGINKIERAKQHASDGEYSLKAVLFTGMYPGVAMENLMPDWSGYSSLEFDVFLEGTSDQQITVRINDRKHNDQYSDRYNEKFMLHQGANHVSIRLDKVRDAPKGRMMDMTAVRGLGIFTSRLKAPRTLYLDDFRLKK